MWSGQMMWGDGWGGAWLWFGLMHALWWVLVIAAIVAIARWGIGGGRGGRSDADRALELLRERYARGEISREEFEERKRVLGG